MTLRQPARTPRGDLLNGRWTVPSRPDGVIESVSPADLDDIIGHYPFALSHTHEAIEAARRALSPWRRLSSEQRAGHLRAYAKALASRKDELSTAISRAIGKPLWESRTEVDTMVAKIEITLTAGLQLIKGYALPEINASIRYRPIGVCVVIGPFNFPGHLANGHIVPALATGNTVVFKPSERAPEVGEIMGECFVEAGFPPGVIQVIQGAADTSRALLEINSVDAVMFTGSTAVGSSILAQSARWPGRLIALELGGKNSAIVLDDADLGYAAREIAFAAYVTAGQRCTSTSSVIVQKGAAEALIRKLTVAARDTRVGAPDQDDVFLGPVISEATRTKVLTVTKAMSDRFESVVPAKKVDISGVNGYYLSPSLYVQTKNSDDGPEHEELFAPVLTIEVVDSEDEAIARANSTRYGLASSVYTASRDRFDRIAPEIETGICNWNRGTVGSSSKLPFGGVKDSGNHRAAGLFSSYYCVDPVAEIRLEKPTLSPLSPGLRVGE